MGLGRKAERLGLSVMFWKSPDGLGERVDGSTIARRMGADAQDQRTDREMDNSIPLNTQCSQ